MSMELVFVQQFGDGSHKRRRLAKACESCRNRKKRCIHVPAVPDVQCEHEPEPEEPVRPARRRFVSDLKPEATFLSRPPSSHSTKVTNAEDIGVWVDKREWDALMQQKTSQASLGGASASDHDRQRPHKTALGPLIDVYFRKVNPILPILDELEFRHSFESGSIPDALIHAMCLVAAKDVEAEPHLRLVDSSAILAAREFCSRLHASVMHDLRTPSRLEKTTLIRVLTLMSLHSEGPDGAEEASMCLVQAMHYLQTLGWHLGQQTNMIPGNGGTTKRIFWCLWSLDRVLSCVYGRPIMMSDIDIAIEPFEPGESGFPAFDVWLYLSRLLNKIITFYRPGVGATVTGWEDDYPSFEDALDEGRGWDLPQCTIATLHLFYLMLAVLSHRSRGVKFMRRAAPSYVRQSLCALELNRLMNSPLFASLHPFPILPYAISLALSVAYKHLRQSHLQHQQEDARQDFRHSYHVLQKMRRTWSYADSIAAISKTVLERLDKATDLSTFRVSRDARGNSPVICTASMDKPETMIDQHEGGKPDGALDDVQHTARTPAKDSAMGTDVLPEQNDPGFTFDGMDDIFATYLDPNNPLHLDDFSFADDFDWNAVPTL